MNQFVRVFMKGEPVRWFDFTLITGSNFRSFVLQARFEGFVLGTTGYIVHDEIKAMMLCQGTPQAGLGMMAPAGQA
jgi:hypothetical protein